MQIIEVTDFTNINRKIDEWRQCLKWRLVYLCYIIEVIYFPWTNSMYIYTSSHCFVFGMISDVSIFWSVWFFFKFMLYFLYLSSTPDFSGTPVTWSLVWWTCAKDRCLHFFIFVVGHCSVFSSIYPFGIVHFIAICVFSLISTLWIDLH